MPELPEVETVKESLKTLILGKTIHHVDILYEGIIHGTTKDYFSKRLENEILMDIGRFGKFLFFRFSTITLISHLRMEGKYFLKHSFELIAKHEHVIFHFTDGTSLRYHDTRKFGTMELVEPGNEFLMPNILLMGPEPFDNQFNLSYLKSRIKSSIRPIKSFLLDQNNVSGLGNIYVDEVLFLSRVHPETQVKNLSDSEILKIIDSTQAVINKAIELGGTTIRSYLSSLGITGRFQNELNVHLRALKPCIICNTPIIKIKVGGRGTYICPTCQKRKG